MKSKQTDPAALLIGVFAVGLAPLTENGPWAAINTVVVAMVLFVLWVYSFSDSQRRPAPRTAERAATAVVLGFILGIGLAWPIQETLHWQTRPDQASFLGLLVGLATAIVLFFKPSEASAIDLAEVTPTAAGHQVAQPEDHDPLPRAGLRPPLIGEPQVV